jgi:hypothetical protein
MNGTKRNLTIGVTVAVLLAACGGTAGTSPTGGSGSTGTIGATGPTGSTGPAGGNGVAVTAGARGAISSLSPLTVNGVRFDTTQAEVRVEGEKRTEAELHKGQVVHIRGEIQGRDGRAATISFDDDLRGKVEDRGGNHMHVGGHEVEIENETEFENETLREDSIQPGERVRVSGHRTASGAIRATRIEKEAGSHEDFEVKGYVSSLAAASVPPAFALRMTPAGADLYQVTLATGTTLPAGIQDGSFVEVRSASKPLAGALTATTVELQDARNGAENDEAEVEGIVTSGDSTAFVIGSQQISTTTTTLWENGLPEDLLPGAKVEAEGTLDAQGVLLARKVSFRSNVRLQGAPSNPVETSPGVGTFQVLGVIVRVDGLTEWKSSGKGSGLSLASLGTTPVQVRGYRARNGTDVIATRVESRNDDRIILQGPVSSKDAAAGTLAILGLTVQSNGGTGFRGVDDGSITASAFFDAVTVDATVVKARGKDAAALSGTTLTAEQMEIEGSR